MAVVHTQDEGFFVRKWQRVCCCSPSAPSLVLLAELPHASPGAPPPPPAAFVPGATAGRQSHPGHPTDGRGDGHGVAAPPRALEEVERS